LKGLRQLLLTRDLQQLQGLVVHWHPLLCMACAEGQRDGMLRLLEQMGRVHAAWRQLQGLP
jgi:hypothetical protein